MSDKNIFVFQDENANYCVIVGTTDRAEAEAALRKEEEVWHGKVEERDPNDELTKPMDFEQFSLGDIHHGQYKGEDCYYWGDKPAEYFDNGKYETEQGFVASLD